MFQLLCKTAQFVAGELFYLECLVCQSRTDRPILCNKCVAFNKLNPPYCSKCGQPLPVTMRACLKCQNPRYLKSLNEVRSLFWLNEIAKYVLHRIKYGERIQYWAAFGDAIAEANIDRDGMSCVIPVPCSFERMQKRGFNQTWQLAERIAKKHNQELIFDGLLKRVETRPQSGLTKNQRLKNLNGSFYWNGNLKPPESVLLIDDVMTTGATLSTCASALRKAGTKRVSAWTLFRTPRLHV